MWVFPYHVRGDEGKTFFFSSSVIKIFNCILLYDNKNSAREQNFFLLVFPLRNFIIIWRFFIFFMYGKSLSLKKFNELARSIMFPWNFPDSPEDEQKKFHQKIINSLIDEFLWMFVGELKVSCTGKSFTFITWEAFFFGEMKRKLKFHKAR